VRNEPSLIAGSEREIAHRSLIAELATVVRVSDRTMGLRLADAEQLVSDFPATVAALEAGEIGRGHARVIVDAGTPIIDADNRARFEEVVLERACSDTPGQLRGFAQLTAAQLGDVTLQERYENAAADRRVTSTVFADGMSQLTHTLPTLLASGIWNRLTQQAKAMQAAGDPRTFDQLRSDLATELLLVSDVGDGASSGSADGEAPHAAGRGIRAEISIVIPALSLPGVDDEPATIAGTGPIDLETAKRLAADADHWVRVITHPVTGAVIAADTYRPNEQLKRLVWARDGRCQFPNCNQPPRRCDLDHTLDWQFGGRTRPENLACLCRGHHTLKHHGGWKVRQTAPGVLEWTSPLGRVVDGVAQKPAFTPAAPAE
jgi:surface antigen